MGADDVTWGVIVGEEVEEDEVKDGAAVKDDDGREGEGCLGKGDGSPMGFSSVIVGWGCSDGGGKEVGGGMEERGWMRRPLGVGGVVEGKEGSRSCGRMSALGCDGMTAVRGKEEWGYVVGYGIVDEGMFGWVLGLVKVLGSEVVSKVGERGFVVETGEGGGFVKRKRGGKMPVGGVVGRMGGDVGVGWEGGGRCGLGIKSVKETVVLWCEEENGIVDYVIVDGGGLGIGRKVGEVRKRGGMIML